MLTWNRTVNASLLQAFMRIDEKILLGGVRIGKTFLHVKEIYFTSCPFIPPDSVPEAENLSLQFPFTGIP